MVLIIELASIGHNKTPNATLFSVAKQKKAHSLLLAMQIGDVHISALINLGVSHTFLAAQLM